MQFVTSMFKPLRVLAVLSVISLFYQAKAQINSPYSRYGLGELYNSRNVTNRAMGGISAAYADYQAVNFMNPASYSQLQTVTFDVGAEMESRSLINPTKTLKSQSGYLLFNYVAIGMPLAKDKKGMTKWGMAFGLRPYTRVAYNISDASRLPGIDSVLTSYKGQGGSYRAFIGTGYRVGGFSAGINVGFLFGQQDLSTERVITNDSVFYFNAMQKSNTSYSKFSADAGFQYKLKLGKDFYARVGANGFLGNSVNASQSLLRQTFVYNANTGTDSLDVVENIKDNSGKIELPAGYSVGVTFEKEGSWLFGGEYETVDWSTFRFYGRADQLANTNMLRFGGHFIPPTAATSKSYFSKVVYRAGFYTGKDMVTVAGNQLPVWGVTFGMGLPIRRYNVYSNQYTAINTSFEYGRRGNTDVPIRETFFRLNVGISLGDLWFQKRKFD